MYCPLLWMGCFFPPALSILYALAHTLLHPPLATIHMICGSELFNGTGHTGSSPFLNKDYMIFGRSIDFWHTVRKTKKLYIENEFIFFYFMLIPSLRTKSTFIMKLLTI